MLICGIVAFLQQVFSICYRKSARVQICKKRKITVIEKIVINVLKEDKEKYILLRFVKRL